ncbi:dynein light chain type 1-domain-containing protein [Pelagophyceae sp. CCMP2097]|nr:dynein light chain type 1-domain-containing protein [Pelagophyceae sp. CCMP2097]
MPDDVIKDAILSCTAGMDGCADFEAQGNDVVEKIKRKFDQTWDPNWHVIIGKSFGSFVTHETKYFISFKMQNGYTAMLYKA